MDVKEQTRKAYELFGKGDMETFFNEMIDDNIVWTFPGKEGVHPLSGVHKGKQAMMAAMSKIPAIWPNFHLKILDMISEGNKVFVRVHATADSAERIRLSRLPLIRGVTRFPARAPHRSCPGRQD